MTAKSRGEPYRFSGIPAPQADEETCTKKFPQATTIVAIGHKSPDAAGASGLIPTPGQIGTPPRRTLAKGPIQVI